jgi:Helix-turn-helix domain
VKQSSGVRANAGRRYRAYPTPEQAERLTEWGHACRAVWNLALEQRQHLYCHRGVTLRANTQNVQLILARAELAWLADLPALRPSRCSASSTAPTTTGGTCGIPPGHRGSRSAATGW